MLSEEQELGRQVLDQVGRRNLLFQLANLVRGSQRLRRSSITYDRAHLLLLLQLAPREGAGSKLDEDVEERPEVVTPAQVLGLVGGDRGVAGRPAEAALLPRRPHLAAGQQIPPGKTCRGRESDLSLRRNRTDQNR